MLKTTTIRARITPTAQTQAEKILSSLGMTASDAIQLLFYQIQFHRGLPFAVTLPKAETAKILQDSRKGKDVSTMHRRSTSIVTLACDIRQ